MDNLGGPVSAERRWGPDRRLTWLSSAMAVAGLVWFLLDRNAENRVVAAVVAVLGLALTAALLRVRVRLAADAEGLTIRGPLHTRRVSWPEIALIDIPIRGRFGRRAAILEIEIYDAPAPVSAAESFAGSAAAPVSDPGGGLPDATLIVFGSVELGADPAEVGRVLKTLRP